MTRTSLRSTVSAVAAAVSSTLLLAGTAHAYLDPGTGGFLLQVILGGIAGAAVVARLYWRKLKGLFVRSKG